MAGPFDHCAADYAAHRPHYPEEVLAALDQACTARRGDLAVDVGAGTGIFTRALAARGWRVIAADPSATMLSHVAAGASPSAVIRCLCGTAESTALRDGCASLVTAAQAFHWFNPPYALAELARVLHSGGVLGLVWNNREIERSEFVAQYEQLIERYNPKYEREYRQQDWADKIRASGRFDPPRRLCAHHEWRLSADALVGFSRSVSYIRNVLPRDQMPRFEADLRALITRHFGTGPCRLPLRADLWTARRR